MAFNLGALTGELKLDLKNFTRNARRGTRATKDVSRSLRRMENQGGKAQRQMLNVGVTLNRLSQSAAALAGGAGMVALGKSFLRTASRVENMEMVLRGLLGTQEEAAKGFENMKNFASQVPFQLQEIMDSYTMLAGIMEGGREQVESWLPLISDLAAARPDIGFQKTTSQIMRMISAGAQAADLFRERGVLGMLGFTGGVSYTVEETRRKIVEAFTDIDSKFRGASERLAKTWTGTMSMIQDKWFQFKLAVMNSGIFAFLSRGLRTINALMDKHKDAVEAWAQQYGSLAATIAGVTTAIIGLGAAIGILNVTGIISGIRGTIRVLSKLAKTILTLSTVQLVQATTGVNKFSAGMRAASVRGGVLAAVLKTSIVPVLTLIIGTVLALRAAWDKNWNGIRDTVAEVVQEIEGWIKKLVGWIDDLMEKLNISTKNMKKKTREVVFAEGTADDLRKSSLASMNEIIKEGLIGTEKGINKTRNLIDLLFTAREERRKGLFGAFSALTPKGMEIEEQIQNTTKFLALQKDIVAFQKKYSEYNFADRTGIPENVLAEWDALRTRSTATIRTIQKDIADIDFAGGMKGAIGSHAMWDPPEGAGKNFWENYWGEIKEGGKAVMKGGEGIEGAGVLVEGIKEDIQNMIPKIGVGFAEEWAKQATKEIADAEKVTEDQIETMLAGFEKQTKEGAKAAGEALDLEEYGPEVPKDFWSRYITRASDFRDQLEPTRNLVSELTQNLLALKMTGSLEDVQEQNLLAPYYWQQWKEYASQSPALFDELMDAMRKIAPEAAQQINVLKQIEAASQKSQQEAKDAKDKAIEQDKMFTETISNVVSTGRQVADIGDILGDSFTKGLGSAISSVGQFASSMDDTLNAVKALKKGGSGLTQAMNFTQMASGALGAVGAVMNLVSALGILDEEQEEVKVGWEKAMDEMKNSISEWADDLTDAIIEFVKTGKFEFKEFVNSVLEDMLRITIRHGIMGPALSALGVEGAAKGGIVNDPTFLSNGSKAGVMGEAGPEAIMPLTRLSDGSLGVLTEARGGGGVQVVINNDGPPISAEVEETGQTEDGRTLVKMAVRSELVEAYNDGFMDSLNRAHYRGVSRKGR